MDEPHRERVRYWDVDLQILADGTVRVTEKITVWAQRGQFQNGIYRDLGGDYFDLYSGMQLAEINILSASINGVPANFRVDDVSEGTRVHIGEGSTALGPGQHDFELHYEIPQRVQTALGSSLDWLLDGDWQVPVDKTQISIHLPPNVDRESVRLSASDGAKVEVLADGPLWVAMDRRLWPGENLSFELQFQPAQGDGHWLQRWHSLPRGHRWAFLGLLALWGYFLWIWLQVGRDPSPGPRAMTFAAPAGVSPGGARLIERLRYERQSLAADIIALATCGQLRIERDAAGLTLHRAGDQAPQLVALAKLKAALFDRSDTLRISRSNYSRLNHALKRHRQALLAVHERTHFRSNFGYWWPGLAIAVATFAVLILFQDSLEKSAIGAFMTVWLSGWSFGVYILVSQVLTMWRSAAGLGDGAGALFLTFFAIPFVAGEIFGLMVFAATTGLAGLAIIVGALAALIGFYHWLKSPTAAGRALLDQVEGLREHLRQFDPWGQREGELEWMIGYAYALEECPAMAAQLRAKLSEVGHSDELPDWFRDATGKTAGLSDLIERLGPWMDKALNAGLAKKRR